MALTKVGKEGITGISNSSDATAITIDSSERVGIGMTSPTAKLSLPAQASGDSGVARVAIESGVDSNDFTIAQYEDTNGTYTQIGQNVSLDSGGSTTVLDSGHKTASIFFDARNHGALMFQTGGDNASTERMRIDSSGNVNIGTTSTLNSSFVAIEFNGTTHNGIVLKTTRTTQTGSNYLYFVNSSGTNTGSIQQTGTTTVAFNTSSDYRLKENVVTDWDATTRLKQLKPSRFNFIADGTDRVVDGFLAHEVSSIVPEAICGEKDAVDDDGNAVYQGIDQSKLVPLLVKTIQELEARITALESA